MRNEVNVSIAAQFALISTILTLAVVFALISFMPDQLDIEYITATFFRPLNEFVSEKNERLSYVLGVILFPLLYSLYFTLFLSKYKSGGGKELDLRLQTAITVSIIILFVTIYFTNKFAFSPLGYLKNAELYNNLLIVFSVLFFLLLLKYYNKYGGRCINYLIVLIGVIVSLIPAYYQIRYTYFSYGKAGATIMHFDAYFYPVYKLIVGQIPVIDFNNIYGFYPYFLAPILNFIGLSEFNFSSVMALLVGLLTLLFLYIFLTVCRNKLIALMGILSFISYAIYFASDGSGIYLQYIPHRMIFPALILALIVFQTYNKQGRFINHLLTVFGYILSTLSIIWNFDTGIVVLLTYTAYHIFKQLLVYKFNDKKLYLNSAIYFVLMPIILVSSLGIIVLMTYWKSGVVVKFADLFFGQKLFYQNGFYMLKMQLLSSWLLIVLIYLIALAESIRAVKVFNKEMISDDKKRVVTILFSLSIIGLGIFSYYQGRSHNNTIRLVSYPAFILLAIYIDRYSTLFQNVFLSFKKLAKIEKLKYVQFILLFALLSNLALSNFAYILNDKKIIVFKDKEEINYINALNRVSYFKSFKYDDKPLDLFVSNSAQYYNLMNERRIPNVPSNVDWMLRSTLDDVLVYLENSENVLILDNDVFDVLKNYTYGRFEILLNTHYNNIDSNQEYHVYKKKVNLS